MMEPLNIPPEAMGPIAAAVITSAVSFNIFFLKWLIKTFSDLRTTIQQLTAEVHKLALEHRILLDAHEEKDQVRHEENLRKFESINVTLAKINNGIVRN